MPEEVEDVIVANALGPGGNPARSIALLAGLPEQVAGITIDRQCCGGLDAIIIAASLISGGFANILLAGGAESYSSAPARFARKDGRVAYEPYRQAPFTPWPDRDPDMNEAAEELAKIRSISRGQQDEWAIKSHGNALRARQRLESETVEIGGSPLRRDALTRDLDPRLCARATSLSGDITVANASLAADAAAFCLITSESEQRRRNVGGTRFVAGVTIGDNPMMPGLAPVRAARKAMATCGIDRSQLAVAEIMEAYAVQAIACIQDLGLDERIVNSGGGSLARGHPVGASGTILAVRLHHELARTSGFGLAAIAAAGGIGSALLLEAL